MKVTSKRIKWPLLLQVYPGIWKQSIPMQFSVSWNGIKAKKQITIDWYGKKNEVFPDPKNNLLGFFDNLGQMHIIKQDSAHMRQTEFSVVPREGS